MLEGRAKLSRGISATTLRERLSSLSSTPLKPVAASLQANIECVFRPLLFPLDFQTCVLPSFRCSALLWTLSHYQPPDSFVPSKVPAKRRIQTLAVFIWSSTMFISCALFLYLWYGTDSAVGRDDLNLAFPQFVPTTMADLGRVHDLGAGY